MKKSTKKLPLELPADTIMGGKVLELYSEKMRRLGKREGKAEGRILGRTEGHREGIEEMTLSMLRNHEPLEKIALYSKLTMERIRELGKVNGIL